MGMSLTQDDLAAIKKLIDGSIDERVPAIIDERVPAIIKELVPQLVQPIIDAAEARLSKEISILAKDTADGFHEVHDKINVLQATADTIQRVQQAEVARVDEQSSRITKLKKALQQAAA